MRVTFSLAPDADLSGPGALAQDPRFIRGAEFWKLGLYEEARLEFENLREAASLNAVDTYRLGNYLLGIGLYRPGIFALRQVLTLAGMDEQNESLLAPPYFSHARYGLYYSELVIPFAQAEGFDPLFLFSVVRQESLFEGFVRSTAGARGLMQFIPDTGAAVANELNWPYGFTPDDLYRPVVSIRFGAHYLATNRLALGGDYYAMLAAYNGGPGNAHAWQQLAGGDPDLLLEAIRFEETRTYIRSIYEFYLIYRRLYGST
jgi:soluble lytic murein transglycosylase